MAEIVIGGLFTLIGMLLGWAIKHFSGQTKSEIRKIDSDTLVNYDAALKNAIQTIRDLQTDVKELSERVDSLEKEKDEQAEKIEKQEKEIVQLRQENTELKAKLEEYNKKPPE